MQPSPDERAASLYAELLERSPAVTSAEVEALSAAHPDLAGELAALHGTRALLDALGAEAAERAPDLAELPGFRLVRRIGGGGMGDVWEAVDLALGRRVALKVLPPLASRSERERERLRREAQAAARLSHPNVVALFSSGEYSGRPYLVQELIEGGRTLRDEIEELRRVGAVPEGYERVTAERFAALADALALAHAEGVVHRDIKPQNVLLAPDGTPKLADFGLAKTAGDASLSLTGEFVGTYLYASPEQVSGTAEVGPASDVFSLGATFYECLTLERPFGGDGVQAVARAILHDDPADPRARRPRIHRDLAVISMRMLEKRPEARYAGASAVRDDLRRWLGGELIHARPPSTVRKLQRAVLRRPTAATAVLLSALAFAAILLLLGRTERARDELALANERLTGANVELEAARAAAETEADTSAEVVAFLSGLFHAGDPLEYGTEPSLKDVILVGAERLRSGEVKDPLVRARLLRQLGVLLSRLGHRAEASSMLSEAVELTRALGRWDTPEGAQARAHLAMAHWDEGRIEDCRELIEPLLERARTPGDLPNVTRFDVLAAMGYVLTEMGDAVAGEARLREALELVPALEEDRPARVRRIRMELATSLLRQGEYAEAAELVEPLCDELAPLLPHGNPLALDTFNLRGKLRLEAGRLDESLRDFESALVAAEANLGERHPRSMNLYNNLATCYLAQRRWDEAEELLRHAIEVSTEVLGAESRETLTALSNLGSVLIGTGRYDEAEELLRAALATELATYGERDVRTAMARSNLAICLYHMKRYGEAADEQARALEHVSPERAEYPLMQRSLGIYRKLAGGG